MVSVGAADRPLSSHPRGALSSNDRAASPVIHRSLDRREPRFGRVANAVEPALEDAPAWDYRRHYRISDCHVDKVIRCALLAAVTAGPGVGGLARA